MPNSVRFHQVLRATPERVYRAFLDPDAMAKWDVPKDFLKEFERLVDGFEKHVPATGK